MTTKWDVLTEYNVIPEQGKATVKGTQVLQETQSE
jgi:hypothetical protein